MSATIHTCDVRKVYRTGGVSVTALHGVDVTVAPGEFVAVMGPSGSGKSALIHIVGGLELPTSGTVEVNGVFLTGLSESQRSVLRRSTIGVVFQTFNLLPNLTVAANVDLPALLVHRLPAEIARHRKELLDDLGLVDQARAFPDELSGGQRQRVAIARALINRPAVLLADEPTGDLDSRTSRQVMDVLRRFHRDGQTIVLVTHDPEVASYADRVVFLRDGQLVDGTPLRQPGDPVPVLRRLVQISAGPEPATSHHG
jgi:putative ABC transport system ATP-binding protein